MDISKEADVNREAEVSPGELERVNAFTYTSQYNPEPAGGFYYFADITMRTGEVLQLELQPNELNHHILPPSSEQDFFSQEWLQSFYGTTT